MINNDVFLLANNNNETISLNGSNILGTNNSIAKKNNFIIINKDANKINNIENTLVIMINNNNINVKINKFSKNDVNNLIKSIEYVIELINDNNNELNHVIIKDCYYVYKSIKKMMLNTNIKLDEGNRNNGNNVIYSALTKFIKAIKLKYYDIINKLKLTNVNKILLDYAKKIEIIMNYEKQQRKINEIIIENMDSIKDTITDNTISPLCSNDINKELQDSRLFFKSIITLSDWYEELHNNNNAMGLLINVSSSKLAKIGLNYGIKINNITTTFFPVIDFIETLHGFFSKNNYGNKNFFGNINKINITSGNAVGSGNAIIPLYINKHHWMIAKSYLKPLLGLTISHNPLLYQAQNINFMFLLLVEMSYRNFYELNLNERWINCFITYLRTCTEICKDNGYLSGIKKYISVYIKNPLKRIQNNQDDYVCMLGQCIASGYILDNNILGQLIGYILEEVIRITLICNGYTNDFFNHIKKNGKKGNDVINEYTNIINIINNDSTMKLHLKRLFCFIKLNSVLGKLFNHFGSLNKFIKSVDSNYGLLNSGDIQLFINLVRDSGVIGENNDIKMDNIYELLGINFEINRMMLMISQNIRNNKNKTLIKCIKDKKLVDVNSINYEIINKLLEDDYGIIHQT